VTRFSRWGVEFCSDLGGCLVAVAGGSVKVGSAGEQAFRGPALAGLGWLLLRSRLPNSCRSLLSGWRVQGRRMPIAQPRAKRALDPEAATGTIGREEVGRLLTERRGAAQRRRLDSDTA
jgi:hypothetical protein